MLLDTGTLIAITIALAGSVGVMIAFWTLNVQLTKENYRLRNEINSRFKTKK